MANTHHDSSSSSPDHMEEFARQLTDMQNLFRASLADVSTRMTSLERRSPESSPASQTAMNYTPKLKLDVPRFDEEDRITVASFYLDGPALGWYQWMYRNRQIVSWQQFLTALKLRFAPTAYDDPKGKLFKLIQTTFVAAYLTEFESLANRVLGLSQMDLLSCFISGLKPEVRREVLTQQPATLNQATGLARLQEEKLNDILRLSRIRPTTPWTKPSSSTNKTLNESSGTPASPPLLPTPPSKPRFRQLTSTEMAERREQGLCFNCDERFSRNHRCKARFLLLIAEDDEVLESGQTEIYEEVDHGLEIADPVAVDPAQLSFHALSGIQTAQTIRVLGQIEFNLVQVLVDGGSTLNFIQKRVVQSLGLKPNPSPSLKVLVGNGEEILSSQVCQGVQLVIQGHMFEVDLYVLGLSGPDVVLGTPWLKQLSPVLMDYNSLTLKFQRNSQSIVLKGEIGPIPSNISYHQLKKILQTEPTTQLYSLNIVDSPVQSPPLPNHNDIRVQRLLRQYATIFEEPNQLPPPRFTDHNIPLPSSASPINVRPYRYPHAQKTEIEAQVKKLLANGWITPSNSPFSSPVLLLKKKDGTWRMCVDYRALNALTIKDRFPLPTVDELLDELGRAQVFSKLDLTSGFHQIRLQPEDCHKTAFRTHDGHYEYRVMPFGLCNASATFQATMNDIFRPLLRRFIIVFFDDILIYSLDENSHLNHLAEVFAILSEHQLFLKSTKCSFAQNQIDYLGHVVTRGTVAPDPLKIQAVMNWPIPQNLKALRGFLGLSGYYRKFIRGYASIALPLTNLLRKDAFKWSLEAEEAFK
ncbi:hypothetical protein A2U01_0002457 [Trifolium medium]|uniref:Reverse transcriptase domain-containing protein n=1 Tax=Trifolium medium TaxID=97028 RepID=A0A392M321_9FABA|nr:hypothetical protein [Trifolium medium]